MPSEPDGIGIISVTSENAASLRSPRTSPERPAGTCSKSGLGPCQSVAVGNHNDELIALQTAFQYGPKPWTFDVESAGNVGDDVDAWFFRFEVGKLSLQFAPAPGQVCRHLRLLHLCRQRVEEVICTPISLGAPAFDHRTHRADAIAQVTAKVLALREHACCGLKFLCCASRAALIEARIGRGEELHPLRVSEVAKLVEELEYGRKICRRALQAEAVYYAVDQPGGKCQHEV